jgi:hypothetical protein
MATDRFRITVKEVDSVGAKSKHLGYGSAIDGDEAGADAGLHAGAADAPASQPRGDPRVHPRTPLPSRNGLLQARPGVASPTARQLRRRRRRLRNHIRVNASPMSGAEGLVTVRSASEEGGERGGDGRRRRRRCCCCHD